MARWVDPATIQKSAGTWTRTYSTNKIYDRRTAADANFNLFVPINVPQNSSVLKGGKIASIDVYYNVTTAALDDFATVELNKQSVSSVGAHTAAAVTTSIDTGHDTAAERKATGEHKMTITITTPEYLDDDAFYVLYMVCDAATTSVFDIVGVRVNYTLRV
jgi:hypothetical protein